MQRSETCPTPNWSQSVENAEWLNAQQHVTKTEWSAVLGEKNDGDFVLPQKLKIPKFSSPESGKIDEETNRYVEMVCTKLRNIKPLLLKAHRTKNNLLREQRKSFSKLAKSREERQILICRSHKDGQIAILYYNDYDAIMTRELQHFEKLDVSVDGSDTYLENVRKDCNELVVKLQAIGELKDELLLPITGMKCKNNAYRKVNGASAK